MSASGSTRTPRPSRSARPGEFRVQGQPARTARFTTILTLGETVAGAIVSKSDVRYRMAVELDGNRYLVVPIDTHLRIQPPPATRLQVEDRSYRGVVEVFGNARNTLTVVNELPAGGVPARRRAERAQSHDVWRAGGAEGAGCRGSHLHREATWGSTARKDYDICDTDQCQVYFGANTEDPLATRAINETRGVVATYDGQPINALYSSTCGGRTESAENIFEEKLPYLVSVSCEYKHPEPRTFTTTPRHPGLPDGGA